MKTWRTLAAMAAGGVIGLGLAGCSASSFIPEPKSDPTRFFVLSDSAFNSSGERVESGPVVRMRRVEVASYLGGRSLVVRRGDHEVEFRDFARWGEPVEQGIARVLREELLARGARAVLSPNARDAGVQADFELTVRVLAFEGQADGEVDFRATWRLAAASEAADANAVARGGTFRASGLRWNGRDEATLAAALSEAVQALAKEIAGALKL